MTDQHSGSWLGNRKIQTKLLLAFGAILLAFLLAVVAILQAMRAQTEARQWSIHSREVIVEISDVVRYLQQADLFIRDLNMSGEKKLAEQYQGYLDNTRQHLDKVIALTVDNATQQTRLRQARDLLAQWIERTADPAVKTNTARVDTTDFAQKSFDAGVLYLTATNAELGKIIGLLDEASEDEHELLDSRNQALEQSAALSRAIILGMFAFGVLVGIFAL